MSKISKLREIMKQNNLDAFLVSSKPNIFYLSNFTGTTGKVLITLSNAYFLTDFRYISQSKKQCVGFEILDVGNSYAEKINEIVNKGRIGFEGNIMTYDEYVNYTSICTSLEFVNVSLDKLRMIKNENEIDIIIKANDISLKALDYCINNCIIPNKTTEIEFCNALETKMKELGATGPSFATIVASGLRSALPHGVASDKVIEEGDFLTIDFGCYYKGYVSDITRTFAISYINLELEKIYKIVQEAQKIGVEAIKPGVSLEYVDSVVRNYISSKGYGEYFGHGTGHGIGIEIHEEPYVRQNKKDLLEEGMIVTVEPGIYLPDLGGVRIEDDVLVTSTGHKILTNYPKELKIIGK